MTVLDKKRQRDIFILKGMLIAVAAIVAIGVGSFVGMLSTYINLSQAKDHYYSRCRMADFWIDLKKAPLSEVKRLRSMPGITELRERISFPIRVDLEGVESLISGRAISLPSSPLPVINGIYLRQGSYFTEKRRNEVIISEQFASARNIKPGDTLHLIMDGQRKKVYVIGTAISPEFIYCTPPGSIVNQPRNFGIFFMKRDYMEDVFGFHGACNNVVGLLTPNAQQNNPSAVLKKLGDELDSAGVFTSYLRKNQFSNSTLTSEMGGVKTMATFMPIMFLGIATLILNVLMIRISEQQRTIVGTLKALGYFNKQIFWHYIQFGIIVGAIGGLAGCVLGYWISGSMTTMYRKFFEFPHLVNQLYSGIMITGEAISLLFAVLGTIHGVKLITKLNPAEAMRDQAPTIGGAVFLERWKWLWNKLDFRWQMILRGQIRNKSRTLIAILAGALGASIVVMAFGLTNSMDMMLSFQFDKVMRNDFSISFRNEQSDEALDMAQRLPGVLKAEPIFNVSGTFMNKNHRKKGVITGLQPDGTMTVPHNAAGRVITVPPSGVLLTDRMAEHLDVQEGDTIFFTPIKGIREKHGIKVVKIIKSMLGLVVYADFNYLNNLLGQSSTLTDIQLKTALTSVEKAAFYSQLKKMPETQSVGDVEKQKMDMRTQFQSMLAMSTVMVIFAAIIFFGSILNSSLISIAERKREIATFRVLGYTPNEVGSIFLRENMLLNIIGTFIGMPLGYYMLLGMLMSYQTDAFSFPTYIAFSTWIYTFVLAVLFVLSAQWIVHRNILKLNWVEALSMKE